MALIKVTEELNLAKKLIQELEEGVEMEKTKSYLL